MHLQATTTAQAGFTTLQALVASDSSIDPAYRRLLARFRPAPANALGAAVTRSDPAAALRDRLWEADLAELTVAVTGPGRFEITATAVDANDARHLAGKARKALEANPLPGVGELRTLCTDSQRVGDRSVTVLRMLVA